MQHKREVEPDVFLVKKRARVGEGGKDGATEGVAAVRRDSPGVASIPADAKRPGGSGGDGGGGTGSELLDVTESRSFFYNESDEDEEDNESSEKPAALMDADVKEGGGSDQAGDGTETSSEDKLSSSSAAASKAGASAASIDDDIDGIDKAHFTFPERLMELLENGVASDAMWWLPGGDAFTIVPKIFADRVLNRYFQGTKFESFTRKLNRWGFKRVAGQRVPANTVAYFHTMFQQGKPELVKNMRSGKKKSIGLHDVMLQGQLVRDFQAAAFSPAVMPNALLGSMTLPITDASLALPTTSNLLRQQLLQQQRNSLAQDQLGLQSLLSMQQRSNDLSLQQQLQLLAAEQNRVNQILSPEQQARSNQIKLEQLKLEQLKQLQQGQLGQLQQLQKEQLEQLQKKQLEELQKEQLQQLQRGQLQQLQIQQELQQRQQALQQQLLSGSSLTGAGALTGGSSLTGAASLTGASGLTGASTLTGASGQLTGSLLGNLQSQQSLPIAASIGTTGQTDARLLQLLLLQQQQKEQEKRKSLDKGGFK